jgi:hypothetical protein
VTATEAEAKILEPENAKKAAVAASKDAIELSNGEEPDWFNFLLSQSGCASVDLSDATVSILQNRPIHHDKDRMLQVDNVVGTIPAELSIELSRTSDTANEKKDDYDMVVLESSLGSSFEKGSCGGQRVAVARHAEWPKLTISEERDVRVWALYSVTGEATLYRADHLLLEWKPQPEKTTISYKDSKAGRPKGSSATARNLIDEANSKKNQKRPDRRQRPSKRADRNVSGEYRSRNYEKGERERHHVKDATKQERLAMHAAYRQDQLEEPDDLSTAHRVSAGAVPNKNTFFLDPEDAEGDPTGPVFTVGAPYFVGMAIFILAHALAIQVCLVTSQQNSKGRRE